MRGQDVQVLTNHLGYEGDGPKRALVLGGGDDTVRSFEVVNDETGEQVFSGIPQKVGRVPEWKDWSFWTMEFLGVREARTYRLTARTDSRGRSFPFKEQENILERHTLSDVIYYFKGQRSAGQYDKADHHLPFEGPRDDTVDVHGGWYDATGDYGRPLSHLSFSTYFTPQQTPLVVWSLFESYDALDARENPNFRQYKRRFLSEALYGADFLVRMREAGGSFYRSVSAPGSEKRPEDRVIPATMRDFELTKKDQDEASPDGSSLPSDNTIYDVSFRAGGGVAIAGLARASTYDATGTFDSETYLETAREAFAVLQEHNPRYTKRRPRNHRR